MGIFGRFKKPNGSGTGSGFAERLKYRWASFAQNAGPAIRNLLPNLKSRLVATRDFIRDHFPRNLEELKEDLRKLQSEEALNRLRKLASGSAYGTYLRLSAAAFAAYFLADTVSLFTASLIPDAPPVPAPRMAVKEDKRRSIDEYASIITRNIFNSKGLIPEDTGDMGGPARKTNLPINLIGTVVLKNELKSIAAIEDKSQNMVFAVRIDDMVDEKIKITKIEHLKVFFINQSTGHLEYVEIVEDLGQISTQALQPTRITPKPSHAATGVNKIDETHVEVERTTVDKAVANLSDVLQQARAIPNFENGMPDGYKILQITPGSIYDQLGVQNGDVICGLNGEPINDPGKAFQMFNELKTASHLEICVKRSGRKMTMNYDIR